MKRDRFTRLDLKRGLRQREGFPKAFYDAFQLKDGHDTFKPTLGSRLRYNDRT